MKKIFPILILWLFMGSVCYSYDNPVALTIAGEAGGEGYRGMYAVACVIANRAKISHLRHEQVVEREFYGKTNKVARIALKTQNKAIMEIVSLLERGELKDITFGATHFENVEAFGLPRYIKKNPNKWIKTCKIGRHTFFKER